MRLFKKLRRKLGYLPEEQVEQIYQAYSVASEAHEGQKRYSGEHYITHPVAVTSILADMHMDSQSLMAALLHDVIEDTSVSKEQLSDQFGETVAELVDGVSKLTQIEFKSRREAQAENFRKMLLAMAKDIRVIIIKLADRLHNMRTLGPLPPPKRRRIAQETLDIYAPIANRLGMHSVFLELENLGFAALYPNRFKVLTAAVRKAHGNRKEIFNVIFKSLKRGLYNVIPDKYELKGREKHLYSIYKKMRNKRVPFSEIMDVYGFRILVETEMDCYKVLGIVHGLYKPIFERFKDYIALPKANGYQSLHTTLVGPYGVPLEIQIRTNEMEDLANNGIAAHWLYKTREHPVDQTQLQQQTWLKNLLEMQRSTGSSIEFIENVKVDLFPDEVYVFTPTGTIIQLPAGATPVDFAYAIHTDIGNTCVAAKIDRQLQPLSTHLANGQTVEIITGKNARPNPGWLDFVVTGKARSTLRHFLKAQRRAASIKLGKRLLNKGLSELSLSLRKVPTHVLESIVKEAKLHSVNDLYAEIGLGNRAPMLVAHQLSESLAPSEIQAAQSTRTSDQPLMIQGSEGLVVNFAECCYPLPGDPIIGIYSAGKGLVVHAEFCTRTAKLREDPESYTPLRWAKDVKGEFITAIEIDVLNKRGVLGDLASAVSDAGANIDDIRVFERDQKHYMIKFTLIVENRVHLADVIRHLRRIKSVVFIRRGKSNNLPL